MSQALFSRSVILLASRAWCCIRRAGDGCQGGSRHLRSLTSEWPVLETNLVIAPLAGNMYLPNAALTFQGNPMVNVGGKGCGELIAGSIALNGNATLDNDSRSNLPAYV